MNRWLMGGAVAVLLALGAGGLNPPDARAQVRYEGGFVLPSRPPPAYVAPRYNPSPPMRFLSGRGTSGSPGFPTGYRFYSYPTTYYAPAVAPSLPAPIPPPESEPAYGVSPESHPWNQKGFEGYHEPGPEVRSPTLAAPEKYSLATAALPNKVPDRHGSIAVLIVRLPEDAALWVEGVPVRSQGATRYLESPQLTPGKNYRYGVRVVWREDGRWVAQTKEFAVRAGEIHGVYLVATPATVRKRKEARIEANLARLSPDDQRVARLQRVCVVADAPLGEHGVPVKVLVKNRRVFVCAEACVPKALATPEETLAKALALRARHAPKAPEK